jgi:hypothetical protein
MVRTIALGGNLYIIDQEQIKTELLQLLEDGTLWRADEESITTGPAANRKYQIERTNGEPIYGN